MENLARIRKTYVMARVEELRDADMRGVPMNWREAKKNWAHAEFNELLNAIRADERAKVLAENEDKA